MNINKIIKQVHDILDPNVVSDFDLRRAKPVNAQRVDERERRIKEYTNAANYYMIGEGEIVPLDIAVPTAGNKPTIK